MANFDTRLRIVWRAYNITSRPKNDPPLSSHELSSLIQEKISAKKIALLVDGRMSPQKKEIAILADFFDVTTDWLCGDDDTPPTRFEGISLSDYDRKEIFEIAAAEGAPEISNFELSELTEFQAITYDNNNV